VPISKNHLKREWLYLYYNFTTGSFHTKKLCSRLYSIDIDFYFLKAKKIAF